MSKLSGQKEEKNDGMNMNQITIIYFVSNNYIQFHVQQSAMDQRQPWHTPNNNVIITTTTTTIISFYPSLYRYKRKENIAINKLTTLTNEWLYALLDSIINFDPRQ